MANQSSKEGLMNLVWGYFSFCALYVALHVGILRFLRRHRPKRLNDGLFALAGWKSPHRHIVSLAVMTLVVTPWALFLVSFVLGACLAIFEDFDFADGCLYVLSNTAQVVPPGLTDVEPESALGTAIDLIVSVWALLIAACAMGIVGSMQLTNKAGGFMSPTHVGLFKHLVVTMPLVLFTVSAIIGAILAAAEDWGFIDGFYFISSKLVGLVNPLTNAVPTTNIGLFIETLSFIIEITVAGCLVGLIAGHPAVLGIIDVVEGKQEEEKEEAAEAAPEPAMFEDLPPTGYNAEKGVSTV